MRCPFFTAVVTLALFLSLLIFPNFARAFTITSDPQYVVMNFSAMNEYDWGASEEKWQTEIKPKVIAEINELKAALPAGNDNRKLAWSTLMEYMNFPFDTPSENSIYAIKTRRILEIAEQENLPVFLPLNGFQWIDELPELYNWWDPDGTKTAPEFFSRQDDPVDFKERFIAGYDPENKWNVEWQDFDTPMNLNWRNWGGGGFRLAPPPNLVQHYRSKVSYRSLQAARYKVIVNEIVKKINQWEKDGKSELFAGITIGTEVSLNASATPKDEFEPYGYRAIQDELCTTEMPNCGTGQEQTWTKETISAARQSAIHDYLYDLTRTAVNLGIPKQRIYTHVWSEALPDDKRYENYAAAAYTPYSRPGISLYGYADKPFDLPDWKNMIADNGKTRWGAVEYSAVKDTPAALKGLRNVLDSPFSPAQVVTLYNWSEHKGSPAIPALAKILEEDPADRRDGQCWLPEIVPTTSNYAQNPDTLAWNLVGTVAESDPVTDANIIFENGIRAHLNASDSAIQKVALHEEGSPDIVPNSTASLPTQIVTPELEPGLYTWYVQVRGCEDQMQTSEPRILLIEPKL